MAHLLELVVTFFIIVMALLMILGIASLLLFSKRWKRFIDSIDNDIDKHME